MILWSGDELYDDDVTSGPVTWDDDPVCDESEDCPAHLLDHTPACPWR